MTHNHLTKRLTYAALLLIWSTLAHVAAAQDQAATSPPAYQIDRDVLYRQNEDSTEYMRRRCRLDVYHPTGSPLVAPVH